MVGVPYQRILRILGSLAILLQASETQLSSRYIGCYEDRKTEWSFFWWPPGRSTEQTASSCNQLCGQQRFSYFGMGGDSGTDCHCGNGGYDRYRASGECTICNYNGQEFACGAKSSTITSIYTTQNGPEPRIDDRFVGCWSADDPKTVLDTSPQTVVENEIGMTLESCLRRCWKRGHLYAGVMLATHCYCGNDLQWEGGNKGPASTSSCDLTCDRDSAHVCGGQRANVIAIYRAAPTETFWGTYIGCFADFRHDWVFFWWPEAKFSRFHPVSACLVQCKEHGFMYYGLGGRNGIECYCGNGNYQKFGPSPSCKVCSLLGETFNCGPRWGDLRLLSVYKIEDQEKVDWRYVGCWTADDPTSVLGKSPVQVLQQNSSLTVGNCINECVKMGMANAGLMRGTQCYCGRTLEWRGTNKRPAAGSSCNVPCSGDPANACGGLSGGLNAVISIYRAECPVGTYSVRGTGCIACNCHEDAVCNRATGVCPGACAAGWVREGGKGPCSMKCPDQKYGVDCKLTCHCYGAVTCNRILGKCPGPCAAGWTIPFGDLACSKRGTAAPVVEKEEKKKDILPIALGAGLGGFFLLVVIIIACCCRKKKEAAKEKQRREEEEAAKKLEEAREKRKRRRRET